ncbi:MurR/RpiR family transcriptional regulator [Oxalobacteraceae bacterium A2-2]
MNAAVSPSPEIAFAQSALGQSLVRVLADGSSSHRQIADYLLRNPMRVTALGIEELAEACQVSTATISRFARDIGFRNFSAMRGAVADTLQAVLQPVEKLRHSIEQAGAAASMEYALANTAACAAALPRALLDEVALLLGGARAVYVMGFGLSAHLAGLLVQHLQPFCPHAVEVVGIGGAEVAAGNLVNIDPRDVLVAISFPRYTLDCVRLASFARDCGASIVALTDSPASPLAELADHALYAPATHPVLASSASAALAVIEALAAALMVSRRANVEKAARLTEVISGYLYGDAADSGPARKHMSKTKPESFNPGSSK